MGHHRQNGVVHMELHTHDLAEVRAFLWHLLGWRSRPVGVAGGDYLTLDVSDRLGGGIVGCGDMITAFLALIALVALRTRSSWAIPLTWLVVVVGLLDTVNAIIQSMRYDVFIHPLGVNWVIVTLYVPALLVSSALILWQLIRSPVAQVSASALTGQH
jgi:hypothetical protein